MKIGILTFHRALNYGAVIQCYVLKEILCELGHNVEIIDYRPSFIEKNRKAFCWNDFRKKKIINKISNLLLFPFNYFKIKRICKVFDLFLKKSFSFSNRICSIDDIPAYYDLIIFGSDQIWNPKLCQGFSPFYFGQFPKRNTKFVSYAASLEGYNEFSEKEWSDFILLLKGFDSVSVREKELCLEIRKRTNQKIENVLDPTLLASTSILKKLASYLEIGPYLLLVTIQNEKKAYKIAKQIAITKHLKIICLNATPSLKLKMLIKNNDCLIIGASPQEFISYILSADYVVTDSFHTAAISLKFEKELFVVECDRHKRLTNLLNDVDLKERFISNIKMAKECPTIDYKKVNHLLNILAIKSLEFINRNLDEIS